MVLKIYLRITKYCNNKIKLYNKNYKKVLNRIDNLKDLIKRVIIKHNLNLIDIVNIITLIHIEIHQLIFHKLVIKFIKNMIQLNKIQTIRIAISKN